MHSFSTNGWTAWGVHGRGAVGVILLLLLQTGLAFFSRAVAWKKMKKKKCRKIIFVSIFLFALSFSLAACYIKWKLQLLFIGLLQMIWSRSRIVEEPTSYDMYVCVWTFRGLSNELKLCIDAFWANNLHRNRTWRGLPSGFGGGREGGRINVCVA